MDSIQILANGRFYALTMIMPAAEPNGFVKTLNNMGFMTSSLDPYSKAFTQFAAQGPGPALEVGAAYGIATLEALEQGSRVIANDIEPRHLEILASRVPPHVKEFLTLIPGRFPEDLNFHPNSLGSVLIARVLHFFPGSLIERAAEKLHHWLSPGGKVFVVAETPYLRNFQDFIPIYEKRVQEEQPWPGFIDDVMQLDPVRGLALPKQMHFLDPAVLSRVFTAAGFQIEKCSTMPRKDFPEDLQLDGRESVGMIAVKI